MGAVKNNWKQSGVDNFKECCPDIALNRIKKYVPDTKFSLASTRKRIKKEDTEKTSTEQKNEKEDVDKASTE